MTELNNKIAELEQKGDNHFQDISGAIGSIDQSNKKFSDKVGASKGEVDATVGNILNALSSILIQSKINKETLNAVKTMNDTSINKIVYSFQRNRHSQTPDIFLVSNIDKPKNTNTSKEFHSNIPHENCERIALYYSY